MYSKEINVCNSNTRLPKRVKIVLLVIYFQLQDNIDLLNNE